MVWLSGREQVEGAGPKVWGKVRAKISTGDSFAQTTWVILNNKDLGGEIPTLSTVNIADVLRDGNESLV